jgi:hypothetical protein
MQEMFLADLVGSAISTNKKRYLGAMEAKINLTGGAALLGLGALAFKYPRALAVPIGVIAVWMAISLFVNSYQLFKKNGKPGS